MRSGIYFMKNHMRLVLTLILTLVILGCSRDELKPYTNEQLANEEFYPYLKLFVEEAYSRGFDFTDYHIDFYFADIDYKEAEGLSIGRSKIVIDREYWASATPEGKEWLLFHELGHSILNREHKNEKTETGECYSFMKGRENDFMCSTNLLSSWWRSYYLDELFKETSSLPGWYFDNQEYELVYANKKDLIPQTSSTASYKDIDLSAIQNFVLEIEFSRSQHTSNSLVDFSSFINFNGYYYSAFHNAPYISIKVNRDTAKLFDNTGYDFKVNVKLTVRKTGNLLQFFVDEQFQHAMEVEHFDSTTLTVQVGNELHEPIGFEVSAFEFDSSARSENQE